jgi:hypothetical protein
MIVGACAMSTDLGDYHLTTTEKTNAGGLGAANATSGGGVDARRAVIAGVSLSIPIQKFDCQPVNTL